jgi:hypothetical protein
MTTDSERASGETPPAKTSLGELALLFLRLGTTAFGGPPAHIALMRDEMLRRRKGLTEELLRPARCDEPHPRTELDGDGDLHRVGSLPVVRAAHGRRELHCASHADHGRARVSVRPVRKAARPLVALGNQAGHLGRGSASPLDASTDGGADLAIANPRSGGGCGFTVRRPRATKPFRLWRACRGGPRSRLRRWRAAATARASGARTGARRAYHHAPPSNLPSLPGRTAPDRTRHPSPDDEALARGLTSGRHRKTLLPCRRRRSGPILGMGQIRRSAPEMGWVSCRSYAAGGPRMETSREALQGGRTDVHGHQRPPIGRGHRWPIF